MSVKLTWLGHSAFALEVDSHPVVVDPFLTGNPLAATTPDKLAAEVILLSHGHGDHLGDTVSIAQRTGAGVVTNFEIGNWLGAKGIKPTYGLNVGGQLRFRLHDASSRSRRFTARRCRMALTAVFPAAT